MRTVEEIRNILKAHWAELTERYRVRAIALFGSYARGEQTSRSDVRPARRIRNETGLAKVCEHGSLS
jgi:predicted nucleotidyltransferase